MDPAACPRCGSPLAPESPQGLCPRCLLGAALDKPDVVVTQGAERAAPQPPSLEELAPLFPSLRLERLIASGGMGAVYEAEQVALGRRVALKVLHRHVADEPGFAERFQREARTLAALSHPGLVSVHDFGSAGGRFFFVMEFVDGVDLRRMIRAREVAPAAALSIVAQICAALQYAHDRGVVHRDIKPENILVERGGRVKILDFGLAKVIGKEPERPILTRSHQVMGTPHYMAPEQWERPLEVDHRADIFALGVVFYELLTGELPLGRFAPPSRKVEIDVRLDEVVLRTLEKEPDRRYQHASDLRGEVEHITATPRSAPARPEEPRATAPTFAAPSQVPPPAPGLPPTPPPPLVAPIGPAAITARSGPRASKLPGPLIALCVLYALLQALVLIVFLFRS